MKDFLKSVSDIIVYRLFAWLITATNKNVDREERWASESREDLDNYLKME